MITNNTQQFTSRLTHKVMLMAVFSAALMLLLAACGGGTTGDSSSDASTDVNIGAGTFIEAQYVAPLPESEALPIDVEALEDGMFEFTVRGAASDTVSAAGTFAETPERGWFVSLSKRDPEDDHVVGGVSITLPTGTEAGTYRLFPAPQTYNLLQEVVGVGSMFFDDNAPEGSAIPFRSFDSVGEGKITLTSIEPLTGAFEFTASTVSGETVTVNGQFKNLEKTLTEPTE